MTVTNSLHSGVMRLGCGSTVAAIVAARVITNAVSVSAVHNKVRLECACSPCATDAHVRVLLLEDLELVAQVRNLLVDLFLLHFRGLARVDILS